MAKHSKPEYGVTNDDRGFVLSRNIIDADVSSASDLDWDFNEIGTAQDVADEVGTLRDKVNYLQNDVTGKHRRALGVALRERGNATSRRSAPELLNELTMDRGFSWSAIAELLQVSVPALRKWRHSGGMSGPNRARLNKLCAFCDALAQFAIDDIATWMDTPLLPDEYYITPRWLYARYDGAAVALLEYAAQPMMDPVILMDYLDPTIRTTQAPVEHTVHVDEDGSTSLHKK